MLEKLSLAALALVWVVSAAACDDDDDCEGPPVFLSFSVSDASPVQGDTVRLAWRLENFVLNGHGDEGHVEEEAMVTASGLEADDDDDDDDDECRRGHVHIYMDDLMSNPLAMASGSEVEVVVSTDDAELGPHTLIARLHDREHRIIEPEVTATLAISILPD